MYLLDCLCLCCGFKVNQIYVDLFMYLIFVCFTGYQDCRFWDPINLYTGNTTTCLCLSQNKGLCFHSLLLLFSLRAFLLSWASRLVVVIMVCDIVSHCFCLILVKILTHQKVTWEISHFFHCSCISYAHWILMVYSEGGASWSWSYGSSIYNTKVVSSNPADGEVYSIQHYGINFVSDLWQVGSFLCLLRFPPPIKLTARI